MELKELKNGYSNLEKKYKLPSFKQLNESFEIERIERDTDTLLRAVRKSMMDKIVWYVGFIETMLHPVNPSPMVMALVKNLTLSDRKIFEEIYSKFIEIELYHSFKRDIEYSEKHEAEAIKEIYLNWKKLVPNLKRVFGILEKNWNSTLRKKEKSYFG